MKYESYETTRDSEDLTAFEFISNGPQGDIPMRILFCPTDIKDVFELIFGIVRSGDDLDYMTAINNNDRDKILTTIALTMEVFFSTYANRIVCFRGSTSARTRLYQIAISLNLKQLETKYIILGLYNDQLMPFRKNLNASAFYIKKRT